VSDNRVKAEVVFFKHFFIGVEFPMVFCFQKGEDVFLKSFIELLEDVGIGKVDNFIKLLHSCFDIGRLGLLDELILWILLFLSILLRSRPLSLLIEFNVVVPSRDLHRIDVSGNLIAEVSLLEGMKLVKD
jgi:hypothetical protein